MIKSRVYCFLRRTVYANGRRPNMPTWQGRLVALYSMTLHMYR